MKFEKLTENKIRITFNLDDLSENNIDFHSFMSNSDETQALFLDMLEKAEKEIGFVTKNYKLMVEALATTDGNFVLTVTRSLPENLKMFPRKIKGKKKNTSVLNNFIYRFNSFDDFCNICNHLNEEFIKKVNKNLLQSRLYCYNNNYYLVLKYVDNNELIQQLLCVISEFSSYNKYSKAFENILLEYGKIIVKDKAFSKIRKAFC